MDILNEIQKPWKEIKEIYFEAFPKSERKPFLIERLDDSAKNKEQRIARRKFYFKNGFTSSEIYITGHSGNMEIMNFGGTVSLQEYMDLQQYALGKLMFRMSGIRLAV